MLNRSENEVLEEKKKINLINGEMKIQNLLSSSVLNMGKNLKGLVTGGKKIQNSLRKYIPKLAKKALKQEKEIKKEIVYNLMVDECHEYFANDILVHNCISWLLGHWFLKYSKNLSFYGIETRDCLSLVNNEGATLTPEKLEERRKIAVLNMEINELKDNLLSAPNLIETKKYEKLLEWKVHEVNKLGDV